MWIITAEEKYINTDFITDIFTENETVYCYIRGKSNYTVLFKENEGSVRSCDDIMSRLGTMLNIEVI